jgi:hypothetical protein
MSDRKFEVFANSDRFWETFFQDVRCDGTDISEDIDSEVESVYPICCTDFIVISMYERFGIVVLYLY